MIFKNRLWSDGGWFSSYQKASKINEKATSKHHSIFNIIFGCFFSNFWWKKRSQKSSIFQKMELWRRPLKQRCFRDAFLDILGVPGVGFCLVFKSLEVNFARCWSQWGSIFSTSATALQTLSRLKLNVRETLNVDGLTLMIRATRSRSIHIYI